MATVPDLRVELRGGYYFGQLERLIGDLQPLFVSTHTGVIELDLEHLVFIGPTAMALLLAAVQSVGSTASGFSSGRRQIPSPTATSRGPTS